MAKIPRDSNLFNNIVKCLRKVTRVELDKYGRTDPIQRFVNKTTDEMTQDICALMDEVTNNLDSMYTEIKHMFNYYNTEMEKIATKFHEKNMCQNDPSKLQAELVKSVTDLNIKAESLKSDLQAQQSEFQKFIHDYILTLQEKSERNYQILNKLKIKQSNLAQKNTDSESIKDMIENYSKSAQSHFTSASMSSNSMFSSIGSEMQSINKKSDNENRTKLYLENTSKNLEEICKKLKITSTNLEHKPGQNVELSPETKNLEPLNDNLDDNDTLQSQKMVLAITNNVDSDNKKREMKSQTNDDKTTERNVKSSKHSDKLRPSHKNDTLISKDEGERVNERPDKTLSLPQKKKQNEESISFQKKKSVEKLEVSRVKALENMPNQMETKLNDLNGLLSQTQSLNEEDYKDGLISRTSSLPDDPSDKNEFNDTQKQLLNHDSKNRSLDRLEYQNSLTTKTTHFSTSDSALNRKIPWYLQSTTNEVGSPTGSCAPPQPVPATPPCCCPTNCPVEPDYCNDPCTPCAKDESHGSVKYDLFESYLCSKPQATRYMDYLDSVKKDLNDQNPNAGVCNEIIMSHTEFLEAIDTRKKLLKSIEKHREMENDRLAPSALAKLKEIVTCKLGRLKSCSAAKPAVAVMKQPKYPHELGRPLEIQQYNPSHSQPATGQQYYLENQQQHIKSLSAGGQQNVPSLRYTFTETLAALPKPSQGSPTTDSINIIHSKTQSSIEKPFSVIEIQPLAESQQHVSESQASTREKQHMYSENQPVPSYEPPAASETQSKYDQFTYSGVQPTVQQNQYSYSEAQPTRQEAYTYSEAQTSSKQEEPHTYSAQKSANQESHTFSEIQKSANHTYSKSKISATSDQTTYPKAEMSAKQESHTYQPLTNNEQRSFSKVPRPAFKQGPYTYSESQSAATQRIQSTQNQAGLQHAQNQYFESQPPVAHGQHSPSKYQPEMKQESQQNYSETYYSGQQENYFKETQPTATQQEQNYTEMQSTGKQEPYKSSQTVSAPKDDQYTPSHNFSDTQRPTMHEPYNHLEVQPESIQTPQHEVKVELSSPPPYIQHAQAPPPTPESYIYPEMRPFEPKPEAMRHHIEQKIAEAAKPKISPDILPVKPVQHIHEKLPIQESEYSDSKSKTNSFRPPKNSNEEYTSKTSNIKYSESTLGQRRPSYPKFEVVRKSLKVPPPKRSTFK